MSLFGALSSSVSGIQAQGTAIGIISDNISNVNTVGYKAGSQIFSTLVTNSGSTVAYSPGGVRAQNRQLIDEQGLLQTTNSPLDIAISGDGFFVVSDDDGGLASNGTIAYTRAGSFRTDSLGNFVNSSGQFLQAWPIDGEGRLPGESGNTTNTTLSSLLESLETVNIGSASGDASSTTLVEMGLNLNAEEDIFKGASDSIQPGANAAFTVNRSITSDQLIVPNTNFSETDQLSVQAENGQTFTFEYGGFAQSEDITAATGGSIAGAANTTGKFTDATNGDSLGITLSNSTDLITFTYTSTEPNTSAGQFNSLSTLATAIDRTPGLNGRVENNRLYVSADDAELGLVFTSPTILGVDFKDELGLVDLDDAATAGVTNRWNTLDNLATIINRETDGEIGAEITSGNTTSAGLNIFNTSPLGTITFTDSEAGDVLAELGLTAAAVAATYNPDGTSSKSMASGNITPQFERGARIYDSLGVGHDVRVGFIKTGLNEWNAEIYVLDQTELSGTSSQIAAGKIEFNGDGSLLSIDDDLTTGVSAVWANESEASSITFDFGTAGVGNDGDTDGLRQFAGPYNVDFVNQNGASVGLLDSVTIDEEGFIIANFNNGQTKTLYKIPLADFANPNGLSAGAGNVFSQSFGSGEVNLKQVGDGGVGSISPSSLESSNSELSEELTDMIVAQRAYQASARVITTADELLDELSRIVG